MQLVPLLLALTGFASQPATPMPTPKADLPAPKAGEVKTAVFAAGCFWCVENVFEHLEGVTSVVSGYAGDKKDTARYDAVSSGDTKHAEAVIVTYDSRTSYGRLLQALFATHDPTTKDRQGPDAGAQYRSAIFYANPDEKRVAEQYIRQLGDAKLFSGPIVTTLEPLTEFFPAEEYHQDFVARHPAHPYVVQWAHPKIDKLKKKHPELIEKK